MNTPQQTNFYRARTQLEDMLDQFIAAHDWKPGHSLPRELAAAQTVAADAWKLFDAVIDREHTAAERQDALSKALAADNAVKDWNSRWQRLGGTSDIRSIVDAETPFVFEPMKRVAKFMDAA